jgi:hypothetical protein
MRHRKKITASAPATQTRDNHGRFLTGNSGGPGRPPGSRNRLAQEFLSALCADCTEHCAAVIAEVRAKNPSAYLRVIATLVQRDQPPNPVQNEFNDLTDDELIESVEAEVAKLRKSIR